MSSWAQRSVTKALAPTLLAEPLALRAEGAWLSCDDGRRYLDAVAGPGVHALGHGHTVVMQAIDRQARLLVHSSCQLNEPSLALAERLVTLAGEPFRRVFFANSGSEGIEAAVKAAKKHTARRGRYGHSLVALENGYHGRSGISLALTGMDVYKRGLPGFSVYPGVVHLPIPAGPEDVDRQEILRSLDARLQDDLIAVVAEPVLGVGGVITPPAEFLQALREVCDQRGAALIFDEIFTGFGRTGTMFAYQHSGVVPDILVVGKALGGGLPIGAVITTEEIGTCWQPVEHSTTFGANVALTAAVGEAVLGEIVGAQLAQHARAVGERVMGTLEKAAAKNPALVSVRGLGLLIGIEFTTSDGAPSPEGAGAFMAAMRVAGVLTSAGGQSRSVVRLTPPLNLSAPDEKFLTDAAVSAIGEACG